MKLFSLIFFISFCQFLFAQDLVEIDDIRGSYGSVDGLEISATGERIYHFDRARDSIVINGNLLAIEPADTINTSPYRFGRSYLTVVANDGQPVFINKPGGSVTLLTEEHVLLFTPFAVDTLFTTDTFFINAAPGSGSNLLLRAFDFEGNISNVKHWKSPYDCYYTINDAYWENNQIYVSGGYGGNADGLLLDELFLDIGTGNGNGFFGLLNENWEFQWLQDLRGIGAENYHEFIPNQEATFLMSGYSDSDEITVCDEVIKNNAEILLGSEFLYLVQFDAQGNCLQTKSLDLDFGSVYPTGEAVLPNNHFLLSGNYTSSYLGIDNFQLNNPFRETKGFIAEFSEDLVTQRVLQLEGSPGVKIIDDVAKNAEGFIWIGGYTVVDTLRIDNFELINFDAEPQGFIAKLDPTFNLTYIQIFKEGLVEKFIEGQDGNLYVLIREAVNKHKLLRIDDDANGTSQITIDDLAIQLFPNPLAVGDPLNFMLDLKHNTQCIDRLRILTMNGKLLDDFVKVGEKNVQLSPGYIPGIYIVVFEIDNRRIFKKLVIH